MENIPNHETMQKLWDSFRPLSADELYELERRICGRLPADALAWLLYRSGWHKDRMEAIKREFNLTDEKAEVVELYLHIYAMGFPFRH